MLEKIQYDVANEKKIQFNACQSEKLKEKHACYFIKNQRKSKALCGC